MIINKGENLGSWLGSSVKNWTDLKVGLYAYKYLYGLFFGIDASSVSDMQAKMMAKISHKTDSQVDSQLKGIGLGIKLSDQDTGDIENAMDYYYGELLSHGVTELPTNLNAVRGALSEYFTQGRIFSNKYFDDTLKKSWTIVNATGKAVTDAGTTIIESSKALSSIATFNKYIIPFVGLVGISTIGYIYFTKFASMPRRR